MDTRSPGSPPPSTRAAPKSLAASASSAYVRLVGPSRTATRSANCVAAPATMAGMEGQTGAGGVALAALVALTSGPKTERRRPLRMVLFPYNNDTFNRRPHKKVGVRLLATPGERGDDMVSTAPAPYYDPYDFEIDADPYPVWKRLRDEAPLYYNEKYDFYAISRYDDVERASVEWQTYSSAKGSELEIIKAEMEMPPGLFIFEDPPDHDLHRGIMSRVFTPRRMAAIEPQVRDYAARTLDPLVGKDGFDFILDLGTEIPMRTIGMLLGIPEEDQQAIRNNIDEGLRLEEGVMPEVDLSQGGATDSDYGAYIDWRVEHPSDDLMTELLNAEFTDVDGKVRTLTRDEILGYMGLLSGAGNEYRTRLTKSCGETV